MSQNPNPANIPDETGLQRRFNLKAFLAGRFMKPQAYGTLDVSLEWPLPLQPNHASVTLVAATTALTLLARPKPGRHMMVLRASALIGAPTAADQFQLIFRKSSESQTLLPEDVVLAQLDGNNGVMLPLVGTAGAVALIARTGVRPIYVPAGFDASLLQTSNVGDTALINWLTVDYPDTQPLTSLGDY